MTRFSQPALIRLGIATIARSPAPVALPANEDRSAPALSLVHAREASTAAAASAAAPQVLTVAQKLDKSFAMHIGANLSVPTRTARVHTPMAAQPLEQQTFAADYFEGLPLRAWAERLGERVMPTVELVQEENKKARAAAAARFKSATAELQVPAVPHLLPISRWAAKSSSVQNTLVAEDPKKRKQARLSWYHPDDTMVPRDWFKGGLLADLKYYNPFNLGA